MESFVNISLGEKIRQIRVAKGLSQENLAHAVKCSVATINRIENGKTECIGKILADIKKSLAVENAPLLPSEREVYKARLLIYNDWLSAGRVADVETMLGKMSCVIDLPFEQDLILMFTLIETRLLIKDFDISAAEEKLKQAEVYLNKVSDETLHMYFYVKGLCYHYQRDIESALKYYLKACTHEKSSLDLMLQINIGMCYFHLGRPIQAIVLLENIKTKYPMDSSHPTAHHLVYIIASCYALIGEYSKAKKMFDEVIIPVRILNSRFAAGEILSNMGLMYIKMKKYGESINLCNEALTYLPAEWIGYRVTLYQKGLALLKMNKPGECNEVIAHGLFISEGDELSAISFNALKHLMTLNDAASIDYILHIAVPHLRNAGIFKFQALDLCKALEEHYYKKRAKTKALAIAAIIREIYEEIFLGDIVN